VVVEVDSTLPTEEFGSRPYILQSTHVHQLQQSFPVATLMPTASTNASATMRWYRHPANIESRHDTMSNVITFGAQLVRMHHDKQLQIFLRNCRLPATFMRLHWPHATPHKQQADRRPQVHISPWNQRNTEEARALAGRRLAQGDETTTHLFLLLLLLLFSRRPRPQPRPQPHTNGNEK